MAALLVGAYHFKFTKVPLRFAFRLEFSFLVLIEMYLLKLHTKKRFVIFYHLDHDIVTDTFRDGVLLSVVFGSKDVRAHGYNYIVAGHLVETFIRD